MGRRRDPFRQKVVVVTGASRGIGRATAWALADRGARVALLARSADQLAGLVAEIAAAGGEAVAYPVDLTDHAALAEAFRAIRSDLGPVDVLVANAGIGLQDRIIDLRPADLRAVMDLNFFAAVAGIQAVLPDMVARGGGHLVLVSSVAGKRAFPVLGGYSASKWALQAVAEALRHELWGTGVRVTTVCPGPISTDFHQSVLGSARHLPRWRPFALSAADVAALILRSIERNHREVVVSWPYRLAVVLLGLTQPWASPALWLILDRRRYRRQTLVPAPDRQRS